MTTRDTRNISKNYNNSTTTIQSRHPTNPTILLNHINPSTSESTSQPVPKKSYLNSQQPTNSPNNNRRLSASKGIRAGCEKRRAERASRARRRRHSRRRARAGRSGSRRRDDSLRGGRGRRGRGVIRRGRLGGSRGLSGRRGLQGDAELFGARLAVEALHLLSVSLIPMKLEGGAGYLHRDSSTHPADRKSLPGRHLNITFH